METLLESIRKASLPGTWSQGVKLARAQACTLLQRAEAELTVRVRLSGSALAPTVTLYVDDGEWTCDCESRFDPCPHVVAACIAATSGSLGAEPNASAGAQVKGAATGVVARARIAYRLTLDGYRLMLTRFIVHAGGQEERLTGSLLAGMTRGQLPAGIGATQGDLAIDRRLGATPRPALSPSIVGDIFGELAGQADVAFDGRPIRLSAERIGPRARVVDAEGGGFRLTMTQDPRIDAVIALGVVRVGKVLHPIAEAETTGYRLERLPLERTFNGAEAAELVTTILPELDRRMHLEIETRRLPRMAKQVEPRIAMDLTHRGHTLSVLPELVYGDPPLARIENDTLVLLGSDVPVRRPDAERALLRRLRQELHLVPGRRLDLDGRDALAFAERLRNWQRHLQGTAPISAPPLTARVTFDDAGFDVVFEAESSAPGGGPPSRAETATVLRAFRDGLSLVPLSDGKWATLPVDWLERHGERIMDLLETRGDGNRLPVAALPDLGALCAALDAPPPPELERLKPILDDFTGIPETRLPDDVRATLRPYQKHGVDWLVFLRSAGLGGILADDMGLGKTVQTLCALEGPTLIVCPKSVVYNWAEEIARFRPGRRVAIFQGPNRRLDPEADITLTTYSILRIDADVLAEPLWDAVVLDEAQAIKNAESQTARAAFGLRASLRIALSGTPVENRLEELWSIMHFANPGLLGGRGSFQQRYVSSITLGDAGAGERLRQRIRPFVLRRMKRDVLPELPPRTDSVLHVELDESERSVYDSIRLATRRDVLERLAMGGNVMKALEALLRLRQCACHAGLVPGQHAETSSKIVRLVEMLEEVGADGHKALVFSQWTSLLDRIEPHLDSSAIAFARLDGSTVDRAAVVRRFQESADCPVLLASLKAGGTGLNLTAADHVFLVDPWWNPAVEDQAADRAHRLGQDRPVMVYRMVAKDTVEERILALQEKKRALFDVALGEADHAGGLTREDLLGLLE
jgi:superfamily II DNA or RNA helicase